MKSQTKLSLVVDNTAFAASPTPNKKPKFQEPKLGRVVITGNFEYVLAQLDKLEAQYANTAAN